MAAKIVRWNPWREMEMMQRNLWRDAERMARDGGTNQAIDRVYPLALDAYVTDEAIVVQASLPGIDPANIDINIEDDVLTIRSRDAEDDARENDNGGSGNGKHWVIRERRTGKFARSVRLGTPVDVAKAEAVYNNGELTLTLPKAEQVKPVSIAVRKQ